MKIKFYFLELIILPSFLPYNFQPKILYQDLPDELVVFAVLVALAFVAFVPELQDVVE